MRDGARARESLDQLGRALGAPDAPRQIIEALYRSTDPFEVGVAATFAARAEPRALVYYNPRRRDPAFIRRVLATFATLGLDSGWLTILHGVLPLTRVSVVAGFDVDPSGVPSGTLYFEELRERLGGGTATLVKAVGQRLGLAVDEGGRVGQPYILAVDFGRGGAERLKLYHFASADERASVCAEAGIVHPDAGRLDTAAGQVLYGEGPCSGYIVQRAHGEYGLVRHKVYRCLPYEHTSTEGSAARALRRLGVDRGAMEAALIVPGFGTTSIGVAFTPGGPGHEYVSVYQCLLRGDR